MPGSSPSAAVQYSGPATGSLTLCSMPRRRGAAPRPRAERRQARQWQAPRASLRSPTCSHSNISQKAGIDKQLHRRRPQTPKSKAAAPFGTAAQTTTEPARLELGRNVVEGRVELGADTLHRTNSRNRNQGRDQTIFDGGRALCISKKFNKLGHLWSPIRHFQTRKPPHAYAA